MAARKTTEQFIKDAVAVHGTEFDYSAVDYVNNRTAVTITCSAGHTFEQRASEHLRGYGCSQCYLRAATFTTEDFIERATTAHGEKYDYSAVDYVNANTKVTITCPEGHTFQQTPGSHLRGHGCAHCSGKATHTTESFIAKARTIHGEKYDYSAVEYTGGKDKVTITCPEGHTFTQAPYAHVRGAGCAHCSGKATHTTESFIAKARTIHGDKYDYSAVEYTGGKDKVTITCPEGHTFEQIASDHLSRVGCSVCAGNTPYTTESFIAKAREVHGDKYGYSAMVYTDTATKVTITCPEHGAFLQIPGSHLRGQGCPQCSEGGGYKTHKEGLLYYLRVTCAGVIRYKIGITNRTVLDRFCPGDMKMIEVLGLYTNSDGWAALNKETFVLDHFKHAQYTGPDILASGGNTEIFTHDVLGLEDGGDLITAVNRLQRDVIRRQVA